MLKNDIRYILKRVIVAILIAFILFFLKSHDVLAIELWGLNFPMNYSYITYGNSLSNQNDFSQATNDTQTFAIGITPALNYSPYFHVYVSSLVQNHNYTLMVPLCTFSGSAPGAITDFRVNGDAVSNRALRSYAYIPADTGVYANNGVVVNNLNACGIAYFNFDYLGTSSQTGITTLSFHITKGSGTSTSRWMVTNYNFEDNGIGVPYFTEQFNRVINASNGTTTAIQEQTQVIQQQTNDQMDTSEVTTSDVDVSNMSGITGLLPAGPVDSLLSLPLTLMNLLVSGTSTACSPFTFTFVFDEQMTLPCFDSFWSQVPSSLLLFLSDLPAVYIFIQWAKSIYKRVERAVSFESSVDDEWGGV